MARQQHRQQKLSRIVGWHTATLISLVGKDIVSSAACHVSPYQHAMLSPKLVLRSSPPTSILNFTLYGYTVLFDFRPFAYSAQLFFAFWSSRSLPGRWTPARVHQCEHGPEVIHIHVSLAPSSLLRNRQAVVSIILVSAA